MTTSRNDSSVEEMLGATDFINQFPIKVIGDVWALSPFLHMTDAVTRMLP
jgi:hypothetical protein